MDANQLFSDLDRPLTRRALLLSALAGPLLLPGCGSSIELPVAESAGPKVPPPDDPGGDDPVAARPIVAQEDAAIEHLLRRTTYGVTPDARAAVAALGLHAWIDQQLDPDSIDDSKALDRISQLASLDLSAIDLRNADRRHRGEMINELVLAKFLRATHSERQLLEVMVSFWNDHFNVDMNDTSVVFLKPTEEREVIRAKALGRFSDLLVASASSPAMLVYLDNARSRADGDNTPNENYARELLELHTVGVDGGYDEDDVIEVAHIFSGWTVSRQTATMRFEPRWHSMDGVTEVLGWSPGGLTGQPAGESFLDYLAHLPQTAHTVATKLCRRFVADTPPPELVERAAAAYLENDTEIAPVVRLILTSNEFTISVGQKTKRPFEYLVAISRAIDLDFDPAVDERLSPRIRQVTQLLGEPVYTWPSPDGPPDVGPPWLNAGTMLQRWRVAMTLTSADLRGMRTTIVTPQLDDDATAAELTEKFAHGLGVELDAVTQTACLTLLDVDATDPAPDPPIDTYAELAALVLVSPNAQRR